jgi:transposase InsO family protein
VVKMGDKTTRTILRALEEIFLAYGYPREIISDHGRQFLREFEQWCEERFIVHGTASLLRTITRPTDMLRQG